MAGEEGPVAVTQIPPGAFVVECPYCGQMQTHAGTCHLSYARTGKYVLIVAIGMEPLDGQGQTE